jgi:hypothetical protein
LRLKLERFLSRWLVGTCRRISWNFAMAENRLRKGGKGEF